MKRIPWDTVLHFLLGPGLLAFVLGASLAWTTPARPQANPPPQPNPSTVQGMLDVTPIPCTSAATQKIATGGTAQDLFPASRLIRAFIIQNVDTTEPLCMTLDGSAPTCGQPGTFVIQAGATTTFANAGSFTAPLGLGTNVAPRIIAATTNHPYACVKW